MDNYTGKTLEIKVGELSGRQGNCIGYFPWLDVVSIQIDCFSSVLINTRHIEIVCNKNSIPSGF